MEEQTDLPGIPITKNALACARALSIAVDFQSSEPYCARTVCPFTGSPRGTGWPSAV